MVVVTMTVAMTTVLYDEEEIEVTVETGPLDPSGDNGVKMFFSLSPVGAAFAVEVTFVVAAAHCVRACQSMEI